MVNAKDLLTLTQQTLEIFPITHNATLTQAPSSRVCLTNCSQSNILTSVLKQYMYTSHKYIYGCVQMYFIL